MRWSDGGGATQRFHVFRAAADSEDFIRLTATPIKALSYLDLGAPAGVEHAYRARAVDRWGQESDWSGTVRAAALPERKEPVFDAPFSKTAEAMLADGGRAVGALRGPAQIARGALDLSKGGFAIFDKRREFDLTHKISVECFARFEAPGEMR